MLKRFENLGTALSRNESKKIVGGFGAADVLMEAPLDGDDMAYCVVFCPNGEMIACEGSGTCISTDTSCQVTGQALKRCSHI